MTTDPRITQALERLRPEMEQAIRTFEQALKNVHPVRPAPGLGPDADSTTFHSKGAPAKTRHPLLDSFASMFGLLKKPRRPRQRISDEDIHRLEACGSTETAKIARELNADTRPGHRFR